DVDVLGHVNNAVSLAAVEDVLRDEGRSEVVPPWSVEVEFRSPIGPGEHPMLEWGWDADGVLSGALRCDDAARSTFRVAFPDTGSGRT
ncbi:MAG: hypothetical protein ACKOA9_04920, partial [Actinomycetota bacterium]